MKLKKPALLKEGDTVALLGLASPVKNDEETDKCIAFIESLGLKVKAYPSARKRFDYLAGTDAIRARDLMGAFSNEKVKAIFSIRGGYGSARILPLLDWKKIAQNPKLLIGFSDITSVLNALYTKVGMVSIHGPMPNIFLKDDPANTPMKEGLRQAIFDGYSKISYREMAGKKYYKPKAIVRGRARGVLVGGNVCLMAGLCGTPYMPKAKEMILFLEELNEKAYKLDRYINQMILAGFFNNVTGVILGHFTNCDPAEGDTGKALDVLKRVLKPLGIPVLANFPAGHERPNYPLPIGMKCELDATKGEVVVS